MAWPHCGRTLGRKLGISAARRTGEVWKLSSSGSGHGLVERNPGLQPTDTRRSISGKPRDLASRGTTGGSVYGGEAIVVNSGLDTGTGIRTPRASQNDRQSLRGALDLASRGTAGGIGYHGGAATLISGLGTLTGFRTPGASHNDRQPLRNRGPLGCDSGIKFLHSSSVESEPSATASRATEATAPHGHLEDIEERVLGAQRSVVPGVSVGDLLQAEDGKVLFSGMTSKELLNAAFNLQLVSYEPLVDLSLKVLTSRLVTWPITSVPILWLVKRTAYSHFCAGEDTVEAGVTLSRLWELGIRGILDYSLEDAEDEKSCDRNFEGFLKTIRSTRSLPPGSVSFACLKISALCPIGLLERVSDHLRWQHKNPEYKLSWRDDLQVLAPESPTYHTQSTPEPLSPDEESDFLKAQQRLRLLCEACAEDDLPVLVDAEYSSIQPAIDYMTHTAAFEYNPVGRPIMYGTLQAYMKDAPARLALGMSEAAKRNVSLPLKLVRGAYITRENALAASLGAPSPIHRSIEDTHKCYDSCAAVMLDQVASGTSAVVLATHNNESGKFAAQRADELGLNKRDPRLQFAQLKGMAESLSFALVHAGFNVSKYIPFGPVPQVIPYLVRRAEENRGLLGNTLADRKRMRFESVMKAKSHANDRL